ncbi:hypothetical protein DFH11DRAFT_1615451, partial [Phellopilus nigrolimitatus]
MIQVKTASLSNIWTYIGVLAFGNIQPLAFPMVRNLWKLKLARYKSGDTIYGSAAFTFTLDPFSLTCQLVSAIRELSKIRQKDNV